MGNGINTADMAPLDHTSDKSLLDANFEPGKKNFLHLTDKDGEQPQILLEDSSAGEDSVHDRFIGPLPREGSVGSTSDYVSQSYSYSSILNKSETGYVGLVNQAMTCYLNSLLQTLFMTPEFRNALYKWEFEESEEDPVTSIPYQLQRLFVLLQTSKKRAIETTDVTRSFGWDSSEAWQQHDVQELCRVMFDALEQKWKQTEQADLINELYQGKLKDYVRCLNVVMRVGESTHILIFRWSSDLMGPAKHLLVWKKHYMHLFSQRFWMAQINIFVNVVRRSVMHGRAFGFCIFLIC